MKKLEAVIFDMDGVLFDTERMSCECCFEAAKQLGLTLAEEAVYGGCGRNEASLRRHIMETEEPWYPNGTFPYEKYRERFMALFQERLERELPVKKGVRELLEYLKGVGDSREAMIQFAHYVEALVAYHRYLGGRDN